MLDRSAPEVRRFTRAANAHCEAARQLLADCPQRSSSALAHEVIYLAGYVVECALKALLLTNTPRKKHEELVQRFKDKLKHNLELLKSELSQRGVELPGEHKENLKRVRSVWSSEMRYDIQMRRREDAERVFDAAEEIFDWVNKG